MGETRRFEEPGPFRAEHLRPGDGWELSNGRPFECLPTGGDGASRSSVGVRVLATDPKVESSGLDAGYAPTANTLRAPDIAIGNVPDQPGWIPGVPPLAVEYAGSGQDERALRLKIADLLARGTRWIWVVRLDLPRRVEVHAPGTPMVVRQIGALLEAPGILLNAVPVEALFDENVANRLTLRNLLQREGYESLDAVRDEGEAAGLARGRIEGLRASVAVGLRKRFGPLSAEVEGSLASATSVVLESALVRVFDASSPEEVLRPGQ